MALALTVFLPTTALVAGLAAHAGTTGAARPGQDGEKLATAADGVYTEEQGKRGRGAYGQSCGPCHGDDLAGGPAAPALVGDPFAERWTGQSIGDLYDSIRTGMPKDNPGSLTDSANIDITAYVLQRNNFPAGKAELETNLEALRKLTISKK